MEARKLIDFIETSFISNLLKDSNITDISYNGLAFYYQHNIYGRQKAPIKADGEQVHNFLRQIANLSEKQFSVQDPRLDFSVGKYRVNAVHRSIGRVNNEPAYTFDIRIASDRIIDLRKTGFMNDEVYELLKHIIAAKQSLVIGGLTSSGKTELQKYLIKEMRNYTRVIVIDSVLELDQIFKSNPDIDLNIWMVDEKREEATAPELVRNALRNNPDWLVVAESRGKEMLDVINSAMTGHPIITTVHAQDNESMVNRMVEMVMMNDKKFIVEQIKNNIISHFHFFVYVTLEEDSKGMINRYISSITYLDKSGKSEELYSRTLEGEKYEKLSKNAIKLLKIDENNQKLQSFLRRSL